jgi:hypothetical protein
MNKWLEISMAGQLSLWSLCGFLFGQVLSLHLSGIVFVPMTISAPHFFPSRTYEHFLPVGRSGSQKLHLFDVHL